MFVGFLAAAACRPAVEAPAVVDTRPYGLALAPFIESQLAAPFTPLDPITLDDRPDGQPLPRGILSADGSTLVTMEFPGGRATRNLDDIWIVLTDPASGEERHRFHPPVQGFAVALSAGGERLLFLPDPTLSNQYPPPAAWIVLETAGGETIARIDDPDQACFRQGALFDPAGRRILCVVDPALARAEGPQPLKIAVYAVDSGLKTGEIELPAVLIGGFTPKSWQAVEFSYQPAVALSPDGRQLAVVHAESDRVTLIEAEALRVEKTFSLAPAAGGWNWFGLAPTPAHAKGEMEGTIRQAVYDAGGRYLAVFTQEIRRLAADLPAERGLWLVDLERGTLAAAALPDYQVQWVAPAPDGSLYAFGTTAADLLPFEIRPTSPSRLWRLDGRTLGILAERPFDGYQFGAVLPAPPGPAP